MGIFIIGIVLLVILFRCSIKWGWKESTFVELFVGILIIIMILEILIHGRDIGREFVSQTELVSLSDGMSVSGSGGVFYVRVNSENSYSYYYEIDSDYKQTSQEMSYKQGTVKGNDVIIIEYENMKAEVPTLYVYHTGHVGNFWVCSLGHDKYEYVFRVPKGTILQQFQLDG